MSPGRDQQTRRVSLRCEQKRAVGEARRAEPGDTGCRQPRGNLCSFLFNSRLEGYNQFGQFQRIYLSDKFLSDDKKWDVMIMKIKLILTIHIVTAIVLSLFFIPVVAETNITLAATPALEQTATPHAESLPSENTIILNWFSTTGIVFGLLFLLGALFYMLLQYSHRLDNSGPIAQVYYEGLLQKENEKYEKFVNFRDFRGEVKQDPLWMKDNPVPEVPQDLEEYVTYSSDPYSPVYLDYGLYEKLDKNDLKYKKILEYQRKVSNWEKKLTLDSDIRRAKALEEAHALAIKSAKEGMDFDTGVLRGRGPEFVLEFTTVVVIIFAAVILGVLNVLSTEQIGTLLAAIAGYVLGRATSRSKEGTTQAPAAADMISIINAVRGTSPVEEPGKEEETKKGEEPKKPTGTPNQSNPEKPST